MCKIENHYMIEEKCSAKCLQLKVRRMQVGKSAEIYTTRQCLTSTFSFFYKASFRENYSMVLKI